MEIFTLEHLYDFLRQKHGDEFVELAQRLIEENVSRATGKLMDNIDIYEDGFCSACWFLEKYENAYDKPFDDSYGISRDSIEQTKKLSKAIYNYGYNNYYADVGD